VRGGDHNAAETAVCDGGLMIDLSLMQGVFDRAELLEWVRVVLCDVGFEATELEVGTAEEFQYACGAAAVITAAKRGDVLFVAPGTVPR